MDPFHFDWAVSKKWYLKQMVITKLFSNSHNTTKNYFIWEQNIRKLYWWYFCIWIQLHESTFSAYPHLGIKTPMEYRIQRIRIQSIAIYILEWRDCLLLWWCCFLQHLRSPPPRLILNMVSAGIPMEVMVDTLGSAEDSPEHSHPPQPKPAVLDDKKF